MEPVHEIAALHILIAAILVWILPDTLIILLIAFLTKENKYASWILKTVKTHFTPHEKERRDSVTIWIQNHYSTLKQIVDDQKCK